MKTYKLSDVERIIGIPRRAAQFYTTEGIITPASGGGKRGQAWIYSETDLIKFRALNIFVECGLTISRIKIIFDNTPADKLAAKAIKIHKIIYGVDIKSSTLLEIVNR